MTIRPSEIWRGPRCGFTENMYTNLREENIFAAANNPSARRMGSKASHDSLDRCAVPVFMEISRCTCDKGEKGSSCQYAVSARHVDELTFLKAGVPICSSEHQGAGCIFLPLYYCNSCYDYWREVWKRIGTNIAKQTEQKTCENNGESNVRAGTEGSRRHELGAAPPQILNCLAVLG